MKPETQQTLIQAAHMVRHLAQTLTDRPLSIANTPFVCNSLQTLVRLRIVLEEEQPRLSATARLQWRPLIQWLGTLLDRPNPATFHRLARLIRDETPIYRNWVEEETETWPMPWGLLQHQRYHRIVAIIGPGIGIGDEIKLKALIEGLAAPTQIPGERIALHSFCPNIWSVLLPMCAHGDLTTQPLTPFRHVDGQTLMLFAGFMYQGWLATLNRTRQPSLEVTLALGEVRAHLPGDPRDYRYCALERASGNYSRALTAIQGHLLGETTVKHYATQSYHARKHEHIHLLINPFTSKHSPLTPSDWAGYLGIIRRAIPSGKSILCQIIPGLTDSCRDYAGRLKTLAGSFLHSQDVIRVLDETGPTFHEGNALPQVFAALQSADLLLTIDTYTAHLAAHTRTISIALCLNRNAPFWDPAPHTFWLTLQSGNVALGVLIRAVTSLFEGHGIRGGSKFIATAAQATRMMTEIRPVLSDIDHWSHSRRVRLAGKFNRLWHAWPPAVQAALEAVDGADGWPRLYPTVTDPDFTNTGEWCDRLTLSNFFRLCCLAAATRSTRWGQA
ncbi:MAG: hypothetical protein HQL75_13260 [Magnetococcales bacterium]|nr:hypothetical protein [Magnetococcales bacterium]